MVRRAAELGGGREATMRDAIDLKLFETAQRTGQSKDGRLVDRRRLGRLVESLPIIKSILSVVSSLCLDSEAPS